MGNNLSEEKELLNKINRYIDSQKYGMNEQLENELIEHLRVYFDRYFIFSWEILECKEILENKLRGPIDYEQEVVSLFELWFDGIVMDQYFYKSWESLWQYANEHGIYEQQDFNKNKFALINLRKLILDITKKPKKKQPITAKDTEYLVYYAACFKDIDMENMNIAIAYFASFDMYYSENLHRKPNELTMLEKINYGRQIVENKKNISNQKRVVL